MKMWIEIINTNSNKSPANNNTLVLFRKLNEAMKKEKYYPSPEDIIDLLKNPYYLEITEILFNKYREKIEQGSMEYEIDDDLILMTIDVYCMIKGIEIKPNDKDFKDQKGLNPEEYLEENEELRTNRVYQKDIVEEYLQEIGQYKLLTPTEEVELAYRIREGDEEARKKFINSNLRLVVNIAKRYQGRGLDMMDLIQEGNIGLLTALDKYDVTKGFRFSTYATGWIRQGVTRAIADKGKLIRVPVHYQEKISALKRTQKKLSNLYNREPTIEELADELGVSIKEMKQLYQTILDPVSINIKVGEEEETEIGVFIASNELPIEDQIIKDSLSDAFQKLFQDLNLNPQDKYVLMARFGLDGEGPKTLEEIGKEYHITRERVRQIESKVIKKIRRSKNIKELAIYMEDPDKAIESLETIRKRYQEEKNPNKAFLTDYGKSKANKIEKELNKMSKIHTIYQYFSDYTKKQIDEKIASLDDRELIRKRYGDNLEQPISSKLTKEEMNRFYGGLVPKMRRRLRSQTSYFKKKTEENETIIEKDPEEKITKEIKQTTTISKEDYERLLMLIQSKKFKDLLQYVSPKEATIIALRFGFVDNKFFTSKSIADFLGINEEEVKEITRKVLSLLKEDTDSFIERTLQYAAEKTEEKAKQLVKKRKSRIIAYTISLLTNKSYLDLFVFFYQIT